MSLPIRWRLTLFIALVIGVILLVLGFALYLLSRDALLEGVEETVQSRAENVRLHIQDGEPLKSREDAINADPRIIQDGVTLIVRDESGDALLKINFPAKSKANDKPVWRRVINSDKPTDDVVVLAGDPYYVYAVPVDPPKGPARVVLAAKTYEWAEDAIEVVATWLAIGFGAAFLLSIGGAYLLAGTALKPVAAVTSAASKMGEGDLSKRLPVANPNDEIGRLTTTINGLLARLDAAFRRLEETLSRQRRFAADASHELRTPLTSISGHARMLDEWALDGDEETARRSVGTIRREAGRMRGLVESLLTLTRGDEGAPMEVGRYDLGAVAKEATET